MHFLGRAYPKVCVNIHISARSLHSMEIFVTKIIGIWIKFMKFILYNCIIPSKDVLF